MSVSAATDQLSAALTAEIRRCVANWAAQESDDRARVDVVDLQVSFGLRIATRSRPGRATVRRVEPYRRNGTDPSIRSVAEIRALLAERARDPTGVQRKVLDILDSRGPSAPHDVGVALMRQSVRRDPKAVQGMMRRMAERGYIDWVGHGRYAAPSDGEESGPMD